MPNPAEETIQASFKGVQFFVNVETQEGGRKVVIHDYPGSDDRFVEDLGKRPSSFRLAGYVVGPHKDKQLTARLEEGTEGILELSSFGSFKVKATTYKKTLDQKELGRVYYSMPFFVTKSNPSPDISFASVESVANLSFSTMVVIDSLVGGGYIVPDVVTATKVAVYDGEVQPQTIADKITALGGDVDTITAKLNNIRTNINDLVRDPVAYAAEL
ncbi:MAG: DNA circularization N-terminal domain-containing protein, partial [Candidatus Peribacteraceae bacterium]|nr:DNA circularization N-terminal domain-containing protein [Candidatus Peribacteraceae bacterium]